jgi:ATP-binding cassette subfamily B protein
MIILKNKEVCMRENIKMLKEWYSLAKPPFWSWLFQFFTVSVSSTIMVAQAIFSAKSLSYLVEANYKQAVINLAIVLIMEIARLIVWDLNYKNTAVLGGKSYLNIQEKIFNKIIHSKDNNFKNVSKEKLLNIFHSDVYEVASFSDAICSKFRYLVLIVLILIYVFSVNIYVAIAVVVIMIINYIILNVINKEIELSQKISRKINDEEFESFSEVIESKNILSDLDITSKVKKRYLDSTKKYIESRKEYYTKLSYLDNYFKMYYKLIIFALTIVMIFILKQDLINFAVYLVITSYLSDIVTNSSEFLSILTSLKTTYISTNRVNIILDFDETQPLEFGKLNKDEITGEIDFIKVSFDANTRLDGLNDIRNISFHVNSNENVLFYGPRNCGKRTIFYLLRRMIVPDNGNIYVDKIKLEDFSEKVHKTNINYLTTKPYFFDDSIIHNLKIVKNDKNRIEELCKLTGMHEIIMALPKQYKTNILTLSDKERYLIGLARLLLMESEILVFYEFPNYLSQKDKEFIKEIIMKFRKTKTILIFSANDDCVDIVDKVYKIEKGNLKLQK